MSVRSVLFDAADTLFHTRGTVGELYWSVASEYGCTAGPEDIQEAFRKHFPFSGPLSRSDEKNWWKDVVRRVFEDAGMFLNFDEYFDRVYEHFASDNTWVLFPETKETLEALASQQIPTGVVSNFDSRLYRVLEHLGILSFFKTITISSEVGFAKPDRRIFLQAARALGVEPWEALLVGDSPHDDVRGAEQAGLQGVLIDRHHRYEPDGMRRIADLTEILRLV